MKIEHILIALIFLCFGCRQDKPKCEIDFVQPDSLFCVMFTMSSGTDIYDIDICAENQIQLINKEGNKFIVSQRKNCDEFDSHLICAGPCKILEMRTYKIINPKVKKI